MATINLGNLTFTHKGDYASGTAYVKNDVVYYSTNGNAYIAKQATQGNAPTSTAHWDVFAQGSGGIWSGGLSLGSAGQIVQVNSGGNALEFANASGGIVSTGGFSAGQNIWTYKWNNTTSTSTAYNSSVDVIGSTWNLGEALPSNKKCLFTYSVPSYEQDWNHTFIRLLIATNSAGNNWDYINAGNSEENHGAWFQMSSSGYNNTPRRTATIELDFTAGQYPSFKMNCGVFGGSNNVKINYDIGNNGTVYSYYQAWFI